LDIGLLCSHGNSHAFRSARRGGNSLVGERSNLSANTDAQMRPLPSVAPGFVRRLPLR
jgi:hypothetical protein